MIDLDAEIAARREQARVLEREIEQLEVARGLVSGGMFPANPNIPNARGVSRNQAATRLTETERIAQLGRPPRPRGPERQHTPMSKVGDSAFGCGHPRTPENSYQSGYVKKDGTRSPNCRTCTLARHKPKGTKPESIRFDEATLDAIAAESGLAGRIPPKAGSKICPRLDSNTGKRCVLEAMHKPATHKLKDGSTFSHAASIDPTEMGGSSSK